jgi:hypothetical protein
MMNGKSVVDALSILAFAIADAPEQPRNRAACSRATRLLTHEDQALNAPP